MPASRFEPRDRSRRVFCNNEHIAIEWTNPGVCPLCASHAEIERFRVAAEKLHAFVNAKGQEHEENALGRTSVQSKTYDEERALVCWQVLDEIEALFQGAGVSEKSPRKPGCLCQWEEGDSPCPIHGDHDYS